MYGHLVYFILKVLAWEICNMKWGFAKKVIIKSQRQLMYGSNFYELDVKFVGLLVHILRNVTILKLVLYVVKGFWWGGGVLE